MQFEGINGEATLSLVKAAGETLGSSWRRSLSIGAYI